MGKIQEVVERNEPKSATKPAVIFTLLRLPVPTGPDIALESRVHWSRMASIFQNGLKDGQMTGIVGRLPPILILALADSDRWLAYKNRSGSVESFMIMSVAMFMDTIESHPHQLLGVLSHPGRGYT
jgi:hypothetical protein